MKSNKVTFKGKFDSDWQSKKGPINLQCVCFVDAKPSMILTSYTTFTNIRINIQIDRVNKKIQPVRTSKIDPKLKIKNYKFFSLFLGFFQNKGINYLAFVEKVEFVKFFPEVNIFLIKEIKVISMEDWEIDKHLSSCLTIIFQKGFYFSFDFDMSRPFSTTAVEDFKSIRNPFWLFYTNQGMHKHIFHKKTKEWIIPVIFGHVGLIPLNFTKINAKGQYCFIQRSSILDIMAKSIQENNISYLTVSNSFHQFDLVIGVHDLRCSLSVCINNLPEDHQNENKATRFFTFMKQNFGVDVFCFYTDYNNGNAFLQPSKNIQAKILKIGKLQTDTFFDFFKTSILPQFSFGGKFINTISFTSDIDNKFYYQGLGSLISFFLIFGKNVLFSDDIIYEDSKQVLHGIENEIIKKLQHFEINMSNFKNIRDYFLDDVDKKGVLKSFTDNIISITNNINESQKDKIMNSCLWLLKIIFENYESCIKKIISENKNDSAIFKKTPLKVGFLIHNCSGFKPEFEKDKEKFGYSNHPIVNNSDILIIGLQEILAMKPNNLKLIFLENNYEYKHLWRDFLDELLKDKYECFFTKNILGLFLLIFVKPKIKENFNLKIEETDIIRLGALNFANKAAIFVKLSINYEYINIFNCHIASGTKEKNCEKRVSNLKEILKLRELHKTSKITFILGDLNFRNRSTAQRLKDLITAYKKADENSKNVFLKLMLETEELTSILQNEFKDLILEADLTFLPSYKFFPGSSEYDYQEGKRVPSHTDRILYIEEDKSNKDYCFKDYVIDEMTNCSDHKPVLLNFEFNALQFTWDNFPKVFDKRYVIIRYGDFLSRRTSKQSSQFEVPFENRIKYNLLKLCSIIIFLFFRVT